MFLLVWIALKLNLSITGAGTLLKAFNIVHQWEKMAAAELIDEENGRCGAKCRRKWSLRD